MLSGRMANLCLPFPLLLSFCFTILSLAASAATQASDKADPGAFSSWAAHPEPTTAPDQELFPAHSENFSIPALLKQNDLPIGLFPSSADGFKLFEDGRFSFSLPRACVIDFDNEVYFAETIAGRLSYRAISDLSGVKANDGFAWRPVTGIRHDDSSVCYVNFDFGPSSTKVSLWQFQSVSVCSAKDLTLRLCEEKCEKTGCFNDMCFPSCKSTVNGGSPRLLQSKCPYDTWIEWDCANECRYQCMMLQEEKRKNDGQPPVKYNGKWPLKRVLGLQEPLSVMFSLAMVAVHLQGLMSFRHMLYFGLPKCPQGKGGPYYEYGRLWTAYGLAALNFWVWSAAFHARNALLLEKIDLSSGIALLGVGLIVAIIRASSLRIEATQVMVAAPVIAFASTHILYLNFYDYNRGWNTSVVTIIGMSQLLIWGIWASFVHHPSRVKLWFVVAFSLFSTLVDIYDFPPLWGVLDAHALWHGIQFLLTLLWWRFIKEDASYRTFQLLRRAQETEKAKKCQ